MVCFMSEPNRNDKFVFHNDRYDRNPKSLVERWLEDDDGFGLVNNESIPEDENEELNSTAEKKES